MVMYSYSRNKKAISLNNLPEEAWTVIRGSGGADDDITALYKAVPFMYRCVDIRAKAIANFPYEILQNGEPIDPTDNPMLKGLGGLLYQTESALCLYAQAYIQKQINLMRLMGLRWLAPRSVKPVFDDAVGLAGFKRTTKKDGLGQDFEIEEIIYFWLSTIENDIGPGVPPAAVALQSAGILDSTGIFAKKFFDRGAIFPVLLNIEEDLDRDEIERLRTWWNRLTNGVKNAWQSIAVQGKITPQIIGPPIDAMAMPELTSIQREDIATALGVPHSMVLSNASNFATATQDQLNFYDNTVIPEMGIIADVLNEQLFDELGLEFVIRPERIEAYQWRNLQNAQGLTSLVANQILATDEAREIVGYEPVEVIETDAPDAINPNEVDPTRALNGAQVTAAMSIVIEQAAGNIPRETALNMLQVFFNMKPDQASSIISDNISAALPATAGPSTRQIHLEQWQRKSLNRLRSGSPAACEFASDAIEPDVNRLIADRLKHATTPEAVKAVFENSEPAPMVGAMLGDDIMQVLRDLGNG